jgi:2',3'-cyclic-nucleotide 2'-phosphodiesterase (5'-nucleotidase family)
MPIRCILRAVRTLGCLVALAALVAACGGRSRANPAATVPAGARPAVQLVLLNDVYVADSAADGRGGLPRVASLLDALRAMAPTVLVFAGDGLSPSLLSKYYAGAQMVESLNDLQTRVAALGNHEFDVDSSSFVQRMRQSNFRWLSANCRVPGADSRGWDTLRVGGRLLGFVGLTLQASYPRWVRCVEPLGVVAAVVDSLRTVGASPIIGLTHQTIRADSVMLAREPRIDFVLGGHDHDAMRRSLGRRFILKSDADAKSAWVIDVSATDEPTAQPRLERIDGRLAWQPTLGAQVARWRDSLLRRLGPDRVVGQLDAPMDLISENLRNREAPFGSLVADAARARTGVDVALINGGSARLDDILPAGPVTRYKLESIFLFADETRLVQFRATGARLRALLEHSFSDAIRRSGGFVHFSGIEVRWTASVPDGNRVVSLTRGGRSVADEDSLTIAFVPYHACRGGDGYVVPEATEACRDVDRWPRTVDALIQYIERDLGGRITAPPPGRLRLVAP